MSQSDSDSEFNKFLQESLSSSLASSISDRYTNKDIKPSSTGLSWLKQTSSDVRRDKDEDEDDDWITELPDNKMKTTNDDPLNFSTGSGYSILSEIEHHLGLRGNSKSPPSSLDDILTKNEKSPTGSARPSEATKHKITTSKQKGSVPLDKVVNPDDGDVTPRISEDDQDDFDVGNLLLSKSKTSCSSLSSSVGGRSQNLSSPLPSKFVPLSPTSLQHHQPLTSSRRSSSQTNEQNISNTIGSNIIGTSVHPISLSSKPGLTKQTELENSLPVPTCQTSLTSFDIIMPQPTGSNIAKDISISSSNSTISNISLPQVKTSDTTSLKHNITSDVSKTSKRDSPTYLTPSNVLTTSHNGDIPDHLIVTLPSVAPSISEPFIVGTSSASYVPATSLTYIPMTSPTGIPVTSTRVPVTSPTSVPITSTSVPISLPVASPISLHVPITSTSVPISLPVASPISLHVPITSTSVPISLPVASPISLHVPITSTSVPIIPTSIPLTSVPIVPTSVPVASPTYVPTGPSTSTHYKVDGERNLDDLLKALAVEQITATIPNDIHKDNNDSHRLVSAPVNESMNGQDVMYWRNELEFEKEKVKELEEKMKDNVRREEKMQLEYARQVQDLRGQILDLRAKLRSLEQEKSKGTVKPPNMEEQERLIQGYQKENERLYSELSLTSKELKSIKSKYHEDTNRLATELANARSKCETQEQTIRHLHQQKLVSHLPYLSDRDEESEQRVEMLERKLQDSHEECQKLQGQVDQLLQSNMTLESELVTLKRDQVDVDLEEMKRKYEGQLIKLRENVNLLKEKEKTLKEKNDVLSQEIEALKRKPLYESQGKKGQPRLIKSHVTSDVRKIKDLEHQVNELQKALKSRHPNSIPALIYASSASVKDSENEDIVKYLERKIERLERDLTNKDGEVAAKISGMDKQLHEMEAIYEQQIEGLKQQIVAAEAKTKQTETKPHGNKEDDSDSIRIENNKLKEQISQLKLEVSHQKLQLEGMAAENEGEKRKLHEKYEDKMKRLGKKHAEKMDALVVNLIQERSESDIARLKTRLTARETRIKQLEEELEIAQVDSETLAVARILENDLRNQVDLLTKELEESKAHHTPEMHHFNSLLAKITQLETNLAEHQKKLQESKDKDGRISQSQLKEIELKYRRQLVEKNKQIEQFREELDSLMDTLHTLQQSNEVIKKI